MKNGLWIGGMKMTLEQALKEMAKHSAEYPKHGYNCACKDPIIRKARRTFVKGLTIEERKEADYLFTTLLNVQRILG